MALSIGAPWSKSPNARPRHCARLTMVTLGLALELEQGRVLAPGLGLVQQRSVAMFEGTTIIITKATISTLEDVDEAASQPRHRQQPPPPQPQHLLQVEALLVHRKLSIASCGIVSGRLSCTLAMTRWGASATIFARCQQRQLTIDLDVCGLMCRAL